MRTSLVLSIIGIIIIIAAVVIGLNYSNPPPDNYAQCKSIQEQYQNYVNQFKDISCVDDNDCTSKAGGKVGFCWFCVNSKIDLNRISEFDLQYRNSECGTTLCQLMVRPCECINNFCQFRY